jgi:very-short-patch-repair endonuclease
MTERAHNIRKLRENRKRLRNGLTPAEAKLWSLLKNSQIEKKKFRRQHSVGPYVLDFYCPSERLCIELDGAVHFTDSGYEYDTARTEYLDAHNIFVLRFENKDVFENTEAVLEEIRRILLLTKPPLTPP